MPDMTVTRPIHFATRSHRRREIIEGARPIAEVTAAGRVPRIARLMALAIKIEDLIEKSAIPDQTAAAQLGHVTRARMTQIMNLLLLAPDIQAAILELPRVREGRDPIVETHLRAVVAKVAWERQRLLWARLSSPHSRAAVASQGKLSRPRGGDTGNRVPWPVEPRQVDPEQSAMKSRPCFSLTCLR